MTNITYYITEEDCLLEKCKHKSYGIVAYADDEEDGPATMIASVRDITSDKSRLTEFVRLCNNEGLSAIHLNDAIEDFLSE